VEGEAVLEEMTVLSPDEEAAPEEEVVAPTEPVSVEVEAPEFTPLPSVEEAAEPVPAVEGEAVLEEIIVVSPDEEAAPEEEALASAEAIASSSLSEIERCKLQLERKPKDNNIRLALARAYRDQEQMKLALEQYSILVRAKSNLLAEAIGDMEGIVASRPDNLEAHELLADLYTRNGQLSEAVDRLRWIQQRLEQKHP